MSANIIDVIVISLCITQADWPQSLCSNYCPVLFFILDSMSSVPELNGWLYIEHSINTSWINEWTNTWITHLISERHRGELGLVLLHGVRREKHKLTFFRIKKNNHLYLLSWTDQEMCLLSKKSDQLVYTKASHRPLALDLPSILKHWSLSLSLCIFICA